MQYSKTLLTNLNLSNISYKSNKFPLRRSDIVYVTCQYCFLFSLYSLYINYCGARSILLLTAYIKLKKYINAKF